ncbi:MAG: hypothetical protein WKF54_01180 [Nocardioidaceae bacterium]
MQQLPLVGAELQRVSAGLRAASRELVAARQVVNDIGPGAVGVPGCDAAVETGLRDLGAALDRLDATASACLEVLRRYDGGDAGLTAQGGEPR